MSSSPSNRRARLAIVGVIVLGLILGVWFVRSWRRGDDESKSQAAAFGDRVEEPKIAELPAIRPGRHQNTASSVKFVGTRACIRCHAEEHQTFLETPHSQALGKMGDATEPASGEFTRPSPRLKYSVEGEGAAAKHRVGLEDGSGVELIGSTFPVKYHIGSGNHSRSYLVEDDGFLFESPLTWYASSRDWRLSPGYDQPLPLGFERIIDYGCLVCHAGRVETRDENRFRPEIREGTIGCESCHGPGELHVAKWDGVDRREQVNGEDLTIVNPARLGRDEAEQICSFCHLRGPSTVVVRGRSLGDYRPGLSLSDFRVDFLVESGDQEMKVTGHVEQMRRSKCYMSSGEMTCITCHDPHARPVAAARPTYFRGKCHECHEERCGLPAEERRKRDEEDCVSCHMPKGATDIPHIAFTHHRIGIHEPTSDEGHLAESRKGMELEAPRLVPSVSLEHLSPGDQARCLGVAYVELAGQQMSPRLAAACRLQAERLLRRAYELGVRDALVTATLAGLEMERGRAARALDLVQQALRSPNGNTGAHENARFIRANIEAERGDFDQAAQTIREVLGARRRPEDWLMLAELEAQRGEWLEALRAARAAERMNPFRPEVHRALRQIETRAGDASQVEPRQQIERALIDGIRASQPRQ